MLRHLEVVVAKPNILRQFSSFWLKLSFICFALCHMPWKKCRPYCNFLKFLDLLTWFLGLQSIGFLVTLHRQVGKIVLYPFWNDCKWILDWVRFLFYTVSWLKRFDPWLLILWSTPNGLRYRCNFFGYNLPKQWE